MPEAGRRMAKGVQEDVLDAEDHDLDFEENDVEEGSSLDDMDDAGLEASGATSAGSALDAAVAALEEVVFSDSFTSAQETFCRAQCEVFEEREENRVEYMTIYEQWVLFLERQLHDALVACAPGGDVQAFLSDLGDRAREDPSVLESDVFDLLLSMTDFAAFKEMMLSYKRGMAMDLSADAGGLLDVKPLRIHTDEMSDGEERPDLDLSLNITSI